ncbi:MAG: O-antigen ligase family protein [Rhodobacteraceae bacterium]|nr:O-antigen ligase family protein [Paracoccaceae bacterium]
MTGCLTAGGMLLGLSSLPAALIIAFCAVSAVISMVMTKKVTGPAAWILAFLAYCCVSGIVFGGFASLRETSLISWIGKEGRVFLYYWPALYILSATAPPDRQIAYLMRGLTLLVLLNVAAKAAVHFSTFGSHHAAGAFAVTVTLYHFYKYSASRSVADLVFLGLSLVALLGTDSRTSVLAAALAIVAANITSGKLRAVLAVLILAPAGIFLMASLFPYQFERLTDAANARTFNAMQRNFSYAYHAETPLEVGTAWELAEKIDLSGNANVAIRGYLFGRTTGEFMRSPVAGIGFGRINDLGRTFSGVPHVYYVVADAAYASPTEQTAHNSFLQILAELGLLGSLFLALAYRRLWTGLRTAPDKRRMWSQIGISSLICILFMALTQHSFGAPIYGLSLFLLAALSYKKCRAPPRAQTVPETAAAEINPQSHSPVR